MNLWSIAWATWGLIGVVMLIGYMVWSSVAFNIPVGAMVKFQDRLVVITAHHHGNGLNDRYDPARYVYRFVDDPPPYDSIVTPLWDRDHWTHQYAGVSRYPKGHEQANQVQQFNRLAEYRP